MKPKNLSDEYKQELIKAKQKRIIEMILKNNDCTSIIMSRLDLIERLLHDLEKLSKNE